MSLTSFNRARRRRAARLAQQQAQEALQQEQSESNPAEESPTVADLEPASESDQLTREERTAQLKGSNWEVLRDLLKEYGLSTNKPKGVSWDDFAIPQILQHEGL